MNIFVIHSTDDAEVINKHISRLKESLVGINILIMDTRNVFWRIFAKKRIKNAQVVLMFLGKDTYKSACIGWEIEQAIKYNKPVFTIKLDEQYLPHKATILTNEFSKEKYSYDKIIKIDDLVEIINKYRSNSYNLFNQSYEDIDKNVLLEQYKVFLQTSEDLVARRQSVNSFYISISSAIIALFSALFAFDISLQYKMFVGMTFSVMGIILSTSWIRILESYGNLNSSKMKILSSIEKQLPASLFDAEWESLSDRLNKKRYVSFTESEKTIPKLFILIYLFLFVAFGIVLILK